MTLVLGMILYDIPPTSRYCQELNMVSSNNKAWISTGAHTRSLKEEHILSRQLECDAMKMTRATLHTALACVLQIPPTKMNEIHTTMSVHFDSTIC